MRFELTQPYGHYPLKVACLPILPPGQVFPYLLEPHRNEPLRGAKNGTRTRDPDLGKVVLYQLSYFRVGHPFFVVCDAKVGIILLPPNFSSNFFTQFYSEKYNIHYLNYFPPKKISLKKPLFLSLNKFD